MIFALLRGSLAFGLISVAAFAVWALGGSWFKDHGGDPGMYAGVAAVFVVLAGATMHPLVQGPRRLARFYVVFVPAFLAYTTAWCAIYFKLGRGLGEWLASAGGTVAFAVAACLILGNPRAIPKAAIALCIGHSLGYFLGGPIHYNMTGNLGTLGRLLWGLVYGLGFGAGIGYCFLAAQERRRPWPSGPQAS